MSDNKVVIVNKHYDDSSKIKLSSFNENKSYREGEVIVSNDPSNVGIGVVDNNDNVVLIKNQIVPTKLSELSDDIDVIKAISDVNDIKLQGIPEDAIERLIAKVGNILGNRIADMVVAKTTESGRVFLTPGQYERISESGLVVDTVMYYIVDEEDFYGEEFGEVAGSILEVYNGVYNNGVLEIDCEVDYGVLIVSNKDWDNTSGGTTDSGETSNSGSTSEGENQQTPGDSSSGGTIDSNITYESGRLEIGNVVIENNILSLLGSVNNGILEL